jgi:hypothetical protein
MLKRTRTGAKLIAVAWLCVLLWGSAISAAASAAPSKDKNPYAQGGFVTSWDGTKIHYIEAGRSKAPDNPEWADVAALLPARVVKQEHGSHNGPASPIPPKKTRQVPLKDRATYGNPTLFRGLRYEPVNEQGVVLLFGMLAKELGYVIEAVQTEFPDCEAMRQVAPERWQRVHIEFEFESRNFRDHGHPASGCDVIVCWRHNWHECPENIEVVELSSVIKSLGSLHD